MKKLIIGIGGVARAGKDTLCRIILERLQEDGFKACRMAFADELKENIRDSLIKNYGIDILNCTAEEKEIVRPELVKFGATKRIETQGQYWTGILLRKIEQSDMDVVIVPDVRYHEFQNDEVSWIKNNNGLLIHVSRFFINEGGDKVFVEPPNEDEKRNDPIIRDEADIKIAWPSQSEEFLKRELRPTLSLISSIVNYGLRIAKR